MYTWTRKEIAEAFEVSVGTVSYWTKVWGPESDHSFPLPVAKLATGTGPHQRVYDPGSVQVWWTDLPAAKTRRMSKAQTGVPRPRKPTTQVQESIRELEAAMVLLMETINEMEALRREVLGG